MAVMMWMPWQNATVVENEFLVGYYGEFAAPHVRRFLETMASASKRSGVLPMHTISPWAWQTTGPGFLNASHFTELLQCNAAFRSAFNAAASGPESEMIMVRLRRAYMAVLLPSLWRWSALRTFASAHKIAWPLPDTKAEAFEDFAKTYNATGTAGIYYNNYYAIPKACVYGCALEWLRQCVFTNKCGVTGHVVPAQSTTPGFKII